MINQTCKAIRFPGSRGQELSGWLDLPSRGIKGSLAIFAHCFTCSKNSTAAKRISESLARCGTAVFRFDFTGLGKSGGDFSESNFSSNVEDIVAASEYLSQHYCTPQLLLGHSFGGAAVIAAADRLPEIKAVVSIAAPSSPQHVQHLFSHDLSMIKSEGQAEVNLAGRKFVIKEQFISDIQSNRLSKIVNSWDKALLILHSPDDQLVEIDNAAELYKWARHPKSYISLLGVDHLISKAHDAAYIAGLVSSWSSRYVPAARYGEAELASGTVRVVEMDGGKFLQHVYTKTNEWLADEPQDIGGDDLGPGPYDLLLSGLGACTSMTLRIYAERKGWQLGTITVDLTYDRQHSQDCTDVADGGKAGTKITHLIRRNISIDGELDKATIDQLSVIADKCPVHKTLAAKPEIITAITAKQA